ncbi:MAG: cupredoxin family copper-binding protein [Archaeoglobaceae archaeon]
MRSKIIALIIFLGILLGVFLAGCAQQDQNGGPYGTPTPSESPTQTPLSGEVTVSIEEFSYSPQSITVETGTVVTWENVQSVTHTVTSEEDLFDSGNIEQDESYSYTFEEAGTYNYYCTIHPSMEGEVMVVD